MKVKSVVLGLAAASGGLLMSANVASADGYSAPARYAAPDTWTGCYLGVSGGWAWGESKAKQQIRNTLTYPVTSTTGISAAPASPTTFANVTTNTIESFDMDGGLIGGTFGCNLQSSGGFVLGIESDASWIDKQGSGHDIAANGFIATDTGTTRERWLATTRLRLGWSAGAFLLYATGGAAFADVEYSATTAGVGFSQDKWRIGLVYGGGAEWKFTRNWSAKLEYLHVDFENQQYFTPPPACCVNRAGGVTLNDDIVRVGINYKFDRREAAPLK